MNNNFTLDSRYLGTISSDFAKVSEKLKEASYHIRKQKSYNYPIFPISKVPLSVGALLIEKGEVDNQWNYYAAYLDVLIQWGLIAQDKADSFQSTYKNPDTFCCLLVVDTGFTHFMYIPYPEEG